MNEFAPMCTGCGQKMRKSSTSLSASGSSYSLAVSGVPVYSCDNCSSSLVLADGHNTVTELTTTIINALDTLAPIGFNVPMGSPRQCRYCRADLPKEIDPNKAHFTASARLEPSGEVIGVEYYGDALSCPKCGRKHPFITGGTCHEIAREIQLAASHYIYD